MERDPRWASSFADASLILAGYLPKELGKLANLKSFDVSENALTGPRSIRTERVCFVLFFVDFQVLCHGVVPGHVPKELAKLTNLTTLCLHSNEGLQAPEGAQLLHGEMSYYDSREDVAAFQACLK